jgi:hypothetical protein
MTFRVKEGISVGDQLFVDNTLDVSANTVTLTGELRGPATLTIDPAAIGDNTGVVVIKGDLQVDGTTTTINSTTVNVDDKSSDWYANNTYRGIRLNHYMYINDTFVHKHIIN